MNALIVCDLDGVVYLGSEPVPGSADALVQLEAAGHEVVFCTNNSWRTRDEVANKIRRATGYPAASEQVITSSMAAATLVAPDDVAFVLGGPGIIGALEDIGVTLTSDWRASTLVVVGLDLELTYPRLTGAVSAVRNGARLVATNDDATFPSPEGLQPGAGALLAAVERATDQKAAVAGKPYPPMRRLVSERAGNRSVWVVGDRPETDVAMAAAEGWRSVLVLSGVVRDPSVVDPPPDLVIERLADLPQCLG